ncbi:MAG: ferritin-like domain-containing protein [Kofleriaceae bacterium]
MSRTPLLRDQTRLAVVHRQRVRRDGEADPAPAEPLVLPAPTQAAAAAGWQALLDTEYESVVIASWMTAALTRLGAPLDLLGAFGKIVEDELRHVDVCAQVVDQLGGRPTIVRGPLPPLPNELARDSAGEFEMVASLLGFFCVFEFLSGLVFHDALARAQTPLAQWAVGEIYRDEAFHGAFGFEAARHFVPGYDEARREQLARRVEAEVARFGQRLAGRGAADAPADELAALERLGLLAPAALLPIFERGVTTQLVPRLHDLGVPVVVGFADAPPVTAPRR